MPSFYSISDLISFPFSSFSLQQSNELLNDQISFITNEKYDFLEYQFEQEKQQYEKELYMQQLLAEIDSLVSRLFQISAFSFIFPHNLGLFLYTVETNYSKGSSTSNCNTK